MEHIDLQTSPAFIKAGRGQQKCLDFADIYEVYVGLTACEVGSSDHIVISHCGPILLFLYLLYLVNNIWQNPPVWFEINCLIFYIGFQHLQPDSVLNGGV